MLVILVVDQALKLVGKVEETSTVRKAPILTRSFCNRIWRQVRQVDREYDAKISKMAPR